MSKARDRQDQSIFEQRMPKAEARGGELSILTRTDDPKTAAVYKS